MPGLTFSINLENIRDFDLIGSLALGEKITVNWLVESHKLTKKKKGLIHFTPQLSRVLYIALLGLKSNTLHPKLFKLQHFIFFVRWC